MWKRFIYRQFIKQIKKDKEMYFAYQSNIAMTIFDNVKKYFPLTTAKNKNDAVPDPLNKDYSPTLQEFCNICAKQFLDLLTTNVDN